MQDITAGSRSFTVKRAIVCLILIFLAVLVCSDQDYYNLLGVSKDASSREIRQAFKKLALKLHPDKNPHDPDAHDNFLKVNRAYEVLKDEDLRKKYDKYGEKGLEDQQQGGGHYESWNFYRYDFGIYDDDLEIVTLDRGEFDGAINSGELWFINFYSPRCSHCHDLAPTWREFAKEMEGLIRIGAVNCGDDRMLCRSQGINSYPSLYIFKTGMNPLKFYGQRTTEDLSDFAMQYVSSTVTELWTGNFQRLMETEHASVGWLITFCSDTGDCLSSQTRLKLAGMLEGLVRVGWMDCTRQANLCENKESTTAYFPPGATLNDKFVLVFESLDAKEIYREVINLLPDLEFLSEEALKVGRFDCQSNPSLCRNLYIHKPCVAAFKGNGINSYEIHHGKVNLYELVAFAKESVNSHVVTLGPDNFPGNQMEPWLVDFFAPWCPPCRALLPELRKASKRLFGQVRFGTLDCTIHEGLCNMHNIRAYPTTVVFNQSFIYEYEGHHNAEQIQEFIEDLQNPSVITLTTETFKELVKLRKKDEIWVVDFYAPWCGPCQALMPEWKRMARQISGMINVGSVDCQKYSYLCNQEHVQAYPEIRLYAANLGSPNQYFQYNGWHRDSHSLKTWALGYLPKVSIDLTPESFNEKVLAGKDHWVLDFYAPWCGPCQSFAPDFERLARMVKGKVKAGKVDCQAHGILCQSTAIRAYPTVKFYPFRGLKKKDITGELVDTRDPQQIAQIITERLETINKKSNKKDEL
uniref:DnaJ homolog subfamily C member 10 n=1 Tax=Leptobrachium leishanense TaxID=445787 RepID=A0A8C5MFF0_9ANUR